MRENDSDDQIEEMKPAISNAVEIFGLLTEAGDALLKFGITGYETASPKRESLLV